MLFGTFQPMFRAGCCDMLFDTVHRIWPALRQDTWREGCDADYRAMCGFDVVWAFPISSFEDAFAHALMTAPNDAGLFFVVETDRFVRLNKVRHYAAIRANDVTLESARVSVDADVSDDESEFMIPVDVLQDFRAAAIVSCVPGSRGLMDVPVWVRRAGDSVPSMCVFPKDGFANGVSEMWPFLRMIDAMRFETHAAMSDSITDQDQERKLVVEQARLKFMVLVMPSVLNIVLNDSFVFQNVVSAFLCVRSGALLDAYNATALWAYESCERADYVRLFQRIRGIAGTPERMMEFVLDSDGVLPGRNDPCPCGSGRKFKKCCGVYF